MDTCRSSSTTEPAGLVADLLYALGWALWTGVVVVMVVQVVPEAKRRQIMRGPDAYEASLRDKAPSRTRRPGVEQSGGANKRSHGTDGPMLK
jgi:hypothetical protein